MKTDNMGLEGDASRDADLKMRAMSRRGFLWAVAAVIGAVEFRQWIQGRALSAGTPWPLRKVLQVNERVSRALFSSQRLAPQFPKSQAAEPLANGNIGMDSEIDAGAWRLQIEGVNGQPAPVHLTLAQIMAFPRVEMTTELKCIEGWAQVVSWTGARLRDVVAAYPPPTRSGAKADLADGIADLPEYVGMHTPDKGYYVGLDMASALHPQTLLAYAMNGKPLADDHGAPLRLAIPVKYGIKNIKRIGVIRYTSERPGDYWAEQGYDWYAGH